MFNRRQFLERTLKTSSLFAVGASVPGFLADTARAVTPGQDTVLVVVELTGGNDGLNTVIPFKDDAYHKARPTLRIAPQQVVRVNDELGLHPGMRGFDRLLKAGQLAIVQGVGYPNPNRSHFESMDVWQSADPKGATGNGWLGRSLGSLKIPEGQISSILVSDNDMPLALQGSATGVATIHPSKPYDLDLGGNQHTRTVRRGQRVFTTVAKPAEQPDKEAEKNRSERRRLIQELAQSSPTGELLPFVQRSCLQTYATIEKLRQITSGNQDDWRYYYGEVGRKVGQLGQNLNLIARMIQSGFGTRVFYVSLGGFDTHSKQEEGHRQLLQELADGIAGFFDQLKNGGHGDRVLVMTFSEFGRRVKENGSKGTDHGAASCLFVAGPGVKGGVVGAHPSLDKLDDGDLKFHTDFRQVYATLLDGWLGCPSQQILGGKFNPLPLLKKT